MTGWTERALAADPALTVCEFGAGGRPVLALHGAGGSGADWWTVAEVAPDLHVVAPDLPGHGRSGPLQEPVVGTCADAAARVLDEYGWAGEAVVVGHSFGAHVALELAARGRCAAFVNLDGPVADGRVVSEVTGAAFDYDADYAEHAERAHYEGPAGRLDAAIAAAGLRGPAEAALRRRFAPGPGGTVVKRPAPPDWRRVITALEEHPVTALYAALRCPAVVVLAANDDRHPGTRWGRWQEHKAGAARRIAPPVEVVVLDAGHALVEERPRDVARLVRGIAP